MAIDFSPQRWETVRETYRRWWARELERPIIQAVGFGREPHRPEPKTRKRITAQYGFDVPVEDVVDAWDYELSRREYMGDAFPRVWPDFGPGVVAAFLGARPEVDENTVWFHAPKDDAIADIHLRLDPRHPWLDRIGRIMAAAQDRWQGLVQVAMTDLGGNLDIVSAFRPSERLLLDLYDAPEEVKRVTWEAHEAWHQAFARLNDALQPSNPGYTAWDGIYCHEPYYMLQCDFCYMISPGMFDEFVKPELAATCRKLTHSFFHLDGVGALPHLDSLLSIPELDGIQWVPGDGQKPPHEWPDLFRRIQSAGKLGQFLGNMEGFERLVDKLGTARGLVMAAWVPWEKKDEALRFLERYGSA